MDQDIDPNESRPTMAQHAEIEFGERLSSLRWSYLVRGIVFLILGLIALFWPSGSVSFMLRIFGFILLLDGAINFLALKRAGGQFAGLLPSLITAILGLVLMLLPAASIKLAFMLLGLWALMMGAGYLLSWWQMPKAYPGRDNSRNTGLLAVLFGLVLVFWPGTGPVALGWTLAIMALVTSGVMFYLASSFKQVRNIL
ncbi:hypothetical protein ROA7450_03131 [Roseovarius albus]|uniref:Acid-resistance membrane protein n=1 Tax=Roseovarius albus TaxID=1247867 RepID=A0A1X6ZT42_9RHOB|nr:DUF308 domain-containing protein [Roseovarius albus]SLN60853.1 hypothetical protein ROA7450_03131 [Roseovarius albus]